MNRTFAFLFFCFFLLMTGCDSRNRRPTVLHAGNGELVIKLEHRDSTILSLILINKEFNDTLFYRIHSVTDTLGNLECNTQYSAYFKYQDQLQYSFLETIDYRPNFCKENLSFREVNTESPEVTYVVQDFQQGSIYRLGKHGRLINEIDSLAGFIRGFDLKDSLLAWCSDSSQLTIKNVQTRVKRQIRLDSATRIHHDLVLHYPYLTALYSRKNYKTYKKYQVIEEGFVRIDLRSNEMKFWSIHDFLLDESIPLDNVKGSFLTAHGNSVDIDQFGDYYISFRDLNQIWKVSSDFQNVVYRIGLNAELYKIEGNYFIGQHSVNVRGRDHFYLFDNGSTGKKAAKSRIVEVTVKPDRKIYEVRNILALPDSLSTIRMGSVQRLNSSLVISVFQKGLHILEIDTLGNVKNHVVNEKSHAIKVLPYALY